MWRKRIVAGLLIGGSRLGIVVWEIVKALALDHAVQAVKPYEDTVLGFTIHWIVPLLMVVIGAIILFGPPRIFRQAESVDGASDEHAPPPPPVPIDSEREFEKGFFKEVLRHNATREDILHLLARLRTEGVVLRNEVPVYLLPEEFVPWTEKLLKWMNEVIDAIKLISPADAEMFATLDAVPPARVPIPNIRLGSKDDRAAFAQHFRQHDFRLAKLEK